MKWQMRSSAKQPSVRSQHLDAPDSADFEHLAVSLGQMNGVATGETLEEIVHLLSFHWTSKDTHLGLCCC